MKNCWSFNQISLVFRHPIRLGCGLVIQSDRFTVWLSNQIDLLFGYPIRYVGLLFAHPIRLGYCLVIQSDKFRVDDVFLGC